MRTVYLPLIQRLWKKRALTNQTLEAVAQAPIPKEKEDALVDEDSELLDNLEEVEGEHNVGSKTVTQVYTELVREQALSTSDFR